MTETPIVFLDTETDGVHPGRKVWEVAMIRRDEHGQEETSFFVDIDLSTADPFGLKVGGFYDRHPFGRHLSAAGETDRATRAPFESDNLYDGTILSRSSAAVRVARWTHGAHIVGAVPNFDTETLAPLLREAGLTPSWHYHLIDIEAMAVGYLYGFSRPMNHPGIPLPWDSEELSGACDVYVPSDEERHTALGDAKWAMRLYDRIVGGEQ